MKHSVGGWPEGYDYTEPNEVTKYMRKLNKEACEQFNSLQRSVQASVSYMKFDNYLQALKIFIGFYNLRGMDK